MSDDDPRGIIDDLLNTSRMSAEVMNEIRRVIEKRKIDTDKVGAIIAEIVRAGLAKTVQSHDERISGIERRQSTFSNAIKRGLTQVLKNIAGDD